MKKILIVLWMSLLLMNATQTELMPQAIAFATTQNIDDSQTITIDTEFNFEDDKHHIALDYELPLPITELELYRYQPSAKDIIQYQSQTSSFKLWESLSHRGFSDLQVVYDRTQYIWTDFFDEINYTECNHDINVALKTNNIYEYDSVDEYASYHRYYNVNDGLYYEVQDLMMGNFMDPDAELTNKKIGTVCNYSALDMVQPPTYNPLILEDGEVLEAVYVTALDGRPHLFMETIFKQKLYQRWIDIELGILVKEFVFDHQGLIVDKTEMVSVDYMQQEDSVFIAPKDIEYKDITMFIYAASGGEFESLSQAISNYFPSGEFGLELTSDDHRITLYTLGLERPEPNFQDVIYVSYHTDESGKQSRIREITHDRYYTVHDGLKTVEIYDVSCYEKRFFKFDDMGLLGVELKDNSKVYTFYDTNNISVSALYKAYQYVITDKQLTSVTTYSFESITDHKPIGNTQTYGMKIIEMDQSVYDESFLKHYRIIDRGEGSQNDGEYMPFWYQ